jgi:phosphoglycerate kinase
MRNITDLDVSQKTVLLRLDLNLPSQGGKFTDASRIISALKTIEYLRANRAKILIISHMGRPKGEFVRQLSLAPIVDELEKYIPTKIKFATDCIGEKIKNKAKMLQSSEILLLENLRFHPGEENNDLHFAEKLKDLADIYINDAFSCSHRSHASIEQIARIMPSAAGFALTRELEQLNLFLKNPSRALSAIIGGAKVSSKLSLLKNLLEKVDNLIIGGAMANTFLLAAGYQIGQSMCEPELLLEAGEIIKSAKTLGKNLLLPIDFVTQNSSGEISLRCKKTIAPDEAIMDLGPHSTSQITALIHASKTVIWNGPLGAFETKPYDASSMEVARNIASASINNSLVSVIGGGDTSALLKISALQRLVTYTSPGGGAFLQWLEDKDLPGIVALSS